MNRTLLAVLLLCSSAVVDASPRVRTERDRIWIDCQSAPLEEMLREIAAVTPMELWLDEGLSSKRVSAKVEGATLKNALEELFEKVDVNYVLYFDSSNPERVTKLYAGSGGGGKGRMARTPTVVASEPTAAPVESPELEDPDSPELPPEIAPELLLESPEAQEALGALKDLYEQQKSADPAPEQGGEIPPELGELLEKIPQLATPPKEPAPKKDPKK